MQRGQFKKTLSLLKVVLSAESVISKTERDSNCVILCIGRITDWQKALYYVVIGQLSIHVPLLKHAACEHLKMQWI